VSTYVTVPIDENGIISDLYLPSIISESTHDPFRFSDVFVYSHGWWTNAAQAMTDYNHFVVDLTRCLLQIAPAPPFDLTLPRSSFPIALHWPSMISEDPGSLANAAELATFFSMGKRADVVGQHGVSSLVRMLYNDWNPPTSDMKLRLNLIGHSFGCRVVCSGLATALTTIAQEQHRIPQSIQLRVVLLAPAFNSDELQHDQDYAALTEPELNLRILATRSDGDTSLCTWYPRAEALNFFAKGPVPALGGAGPSAQTLTDFASSGTAISVGPGFTYKGVVTNTERLVVADLSTLHAANPNHVTSQFAGHHSDIYYNEIYELIAGFLFTRYPLGVAPPPESRPPVLESPVTVR